MRTQLQPPHTPDPDRTLHCDHLQTKHEARPPIGVRPLTWSVSRPSEGNHSTDLAEAGAFTDQEKGQGEHRVGS